MKEKINLQLMKHETSLEEWELNELVRELYRFLDLFNKHFFNDSLPPAVIEVANTRYDRFGHYVRGRSGLGLMHTININRQHINRHRVLVLKTLEHEMIHLDQDTRSECTGYHNKAFQLKSIELGIPVNKKGVTIGLTDPFVSFMREHLPDNLKDFNLEELLRELHTPIKKGQGKSTLKKWGCGCRSCRVGTSDFEDVLCRRCGKDFVEV